MYKEIKHMKDKLHREINGLKLLECDNRHTSIENNIIIKEKRKQYDFYNNLLKAFH